MSRYRLIGFHSHCEEEVSVDSESITLVNRKLFNTLPEGEPTHLHDYHMKRPFYVEIWREREHTSFHLQMRKYQLADNSGILMKSFIGNFTFKVNGVVLCPTTRLCLINTKY